MRHRKKNGSHFNLKSGPRKALLKGLLNSLVNHERIKTTLPKAKTLRPLIEKAITLGTKANLSAQRLLLSRLSNKANVKKIMQDLAPRFKERSGGYTRIIKLGYRPGDQAPKALIEFVDYQFKPSLTDEEKQKEKASPERKKERRLWYKKKEAQRKRIRLLQVESRRTNR